MTHGYLHKKDTFELNPNHHPPARNYPFEQICVECRYLKVLRHFFPRPVIEHVTDHYTIDAAAGQSCLHYLVTADR